jgi:hypothetical protein
VGKRYAEGTGVPVEKSRSEITGILTTHGCRRMAWATEPNGDTLQFELGGQQYRFNIVRPSTDDVQRMYANLYSPQVDWEKKVAAEWRRRWRAHVLLLKAKLEFVEGGDTTLEAEFMPALVTKNGATLGELIASDTGRRLLLGAGG